MAPPGTPRVWDGRRVVLFLGAIMVLIAIALAVGPAALYDDIRRAELDVPAETHQQ